MTLHSMWVEREKMMLQGTTEHRANYQQKEAVANGRVRVREEARVSSAPFEGTTTYQTGFQRVQGSPPLRMRDAGDRSQAFRPAETIYTGLGDFTWSTTQRNDFGAKTVDICPAEKVLSRRCAAFLPIPLQRQELQLLSTKIQPRLLPACPPRPDRSPPNDSCLLTPYAQ